MNEGWMHDQWIAGHCQIEQTNQIEDFRPKQIDSNQFIQNKSANQFESWIGMH